MMKLYATEIKWSMIFTVMTLAWMIFEKLMGWHAENITDHAIYTNLYAIPATLVYVFALREKKHGDLNGNMSWKQGFRSGFIISVIIAALTPISTFITHEFISPVYFENISEYSVQMEYMSQEEAVAYFTLQNYILQGVIVALIYGTITSAIIPIFLRTKKRQE